MGGPDSIESEQEIEIAQKLQIPISRVRSYTSFYSGSQGDKVCVGLPCLLKSGNNSKFDSGETTTCLGYCEHAPVIRKGGRFFQVKEHGLTEIEESGWEHVLVKRESYESYVKSDGYSFYNNMMNSSTQDSVLKILEDVSLRGMGGAGFPVHLKWKSFRENANSESILLVNAHEGEPGTFKDREIMELHPHSLLEGAAIAAVSNGISRIVIAIKMEYEVAYKSLKMAIEEFNRKIRKDLSKKRDPVFEIKRIRGFYVTGEETALMEAIEGKRSEPRLRPPFPTEVGLYGLPTLVHNVETLSLIPAILKDPAKGIEKRFCISGDVSSPGTFTATQGITASEFVQKIGKIDPKSLKAFLPGGLSGGVLPASSLGVHLDSDSVRKVGASMGTGAFLAISKERCMVDITKRVTEFFETESCGKCAPCRLGTVELKRMLQGFTQGKGSATDIENGKNIAQAMISGSICALGQASGKMFLDSLLHFEGEYEDHINGICRTGTCEMGGD